MRQILYSLVVSILFVSSNVWAHGGYGHGHHHRYNHYHSAGSYNWLFPAVVGGVIGYTIARPPVVVQQPIIVAPQVLEVPPAPLGYHYENVLDAHCNCYRTVLIAN